MKHAALVSSLLGSVCYIACASAQTSTNVEPSAATPPLPANHRAAGPKVAPVSGLEEVVVTAQRRSESLQKVPVAVTAIGSKALAVRGITGLSSLADSTTPGLVVTPYAGTPAALTFSIRGASSPDPATGLSELAVSVYEDGVPLGRIVGAGIDLGDIERIEILRGPQGTLFGRNAEGGAVQYVTRPPSGVFGGSIDEQYGNFNHDRTLAKVTLPEFKNFSIELSGLVDSHDGFVKNAPLKPGDTATNHNDLGLYDQKGFRVAVRWEPSPDFSAYYTFDYSDLDFTNTYTLRTGGRTPTEPGFCSVPSFSPICASPQGLAANIYQNTRQPDSGRPNTTDLPFDLPINHNRVRGNGLTLSWTVSDVLQIKSITGYRTVNENSGNNLGDALAFVQFVPSQYFAFVPPGTVEAVSGTVAKAVVDQSQVSQELQFLVNAGRFKVTAGLFYYREQVTDTRDTNFDLVYEYTGHPGFLTPFTVNAFPLQVNPLTGKSASLQTFDATANSYAAYSQVTYTPPGFDDQLHMTAGFRFTHDEKQFTRTVFEGAPDDAKSFFRASRADPAVILSYDLNPSVDLYAKYSSAYRAGGVNVRDKLALSPYQSDTNEEFESGFKSQFFENRVRFNVAAYRSRISGYQISTPDDAADPSSNLTLNSPKPLYFVGIENELSYRVLPDLTLGVSYAFMNSTGPSKITGPTGTLYDFHIPYAPKNQVALTSDYAIPLNDALRINLHADYNYSSSSTGTPIQQIPGYVHAANQTLHTANARVALEGIHLNRDATATLALFAHNIFNSRDYQFAFQTGTADFTVRPPGGAANPIDPQTYGVELKVDF